MNKNILHFGIDMLINVLTNVNKRALIAKRYHGNLNILVYISIYDACALHILVKLGFAVFGFNILTV